MDITPFIPPIKGSDVEEAKKTGAVEAGCDELIEKISGGWLDFDVEEAD